MDLESVFGTWSISVMLYQPGSSWCKLKGCWDSQWYLQNNDDWYYLYWTRIRRYAYSDSERFCLDQWSRYFTMTLKHVHGLTWLYRGATRWYIWRIAAKIKVATWSHGWAGLCARHECIGSTFLDSASWNGSLLCIFQTPMALVPIVCTIHAQRCPLWSQGQLIIFLNLHIMMSNDPML